MDSIPGTIHLQSRSFSFAYPDDRGTRTAYQQLIERIRQIPAVEASDLLMSFRWPATRELRRVGLAQRNPFRYNRLRLVVTGPAVGTAIALTLTRLLSSFSRLLYGVSANDPLTFIAVSLILLGVVALACYISARRATRVDPMTALGISVSAARRHFWADRRDARVSPHFGSRMPSRDALPLRCFTRSK